eukprot:TRINITY_DN2636_c0_g2_i6.p1 TRINITY_DN2636_c0_g2~~TRINITY_DN2636_c0_g2_i6.p1  ORF type:complete len:304 (+),score=63.82 TRINITY_DN2636_c0_g2_i6:272-1183(+)
MNLGDAMRRSEVFEYSLQQALYPHMKGIVPLPSVYYEDFIALNQKDRADNCIAGVSKQEHLNRIREDIRKFKAANKLDKVILLWTANTERFANEVEGINDTAENLLRSIERNETEVSQSTVFAVASILEGCSYINGSPQNTFVPGVIELADKHRVFIVGNDFKTGQTKIKTMLADFLVAAGIKPVSVVSYNHLGNNDGMNLSSESQFKSKEKSKKSCIEDILSSNQILYKDGDTNIDHTRRLWTSTFLRSSWADTTHLQFTTFARILFLPLQLFLTLCSLLSCSSVSSTRPTRLLSSRDLTQC